VAFGLKPTPLAGEMGLTWFLLGCCQKKGQKNPGPVRERNISRVACDQRNELKKETAVRVISARERAAP